MSCGHHCTEPDDCGICAPKMDDEPTATGREQDRAADEHFDRLERLGDEVAY